MSISKFNEYSNEQTLEVLNSCCTSTAWQNKVATARPFESAQALLNAQEKIWKGLERKDFLEAFGGHPKIGDVSSLKTKYAHTKDLASDEQSGVDSASDEIINELARFNQKYEERFGYIFIVCATGKSALEMLNILKSRIDNEASAELLVAAGEQAKITKIRMEKIL